MSKLPLDAKLLSNAVIELNIARHILSLYSREHQLVQLSLDKTIAILADLFELRPEISLAVAKDTLIIDERPLDPKNPVYREFALALSRMSVAAGFVRQGRDPGRGVRLSPFPRAGCDGHLVRDAAGDPRGVPVAAHPGRAARLPRLRLRRRPDEEGRLRRIPARALHQGAARRRISPRTACRPSSRMSNPGRSPF